LAIYFISRSPNRCDSLNLKPFLAQPKKPLEILEGSKNLDVSSIQTKFQLPETYKPQFLKAPTSLKPIQPIGPWKVLAVGEGNDAVKQDQQDLLVFPQDLGIQKFGVGYG
jgi:hypothetical protein